MLVKTIIQFHRVKPWGKKEKGKKTMLQIPCRRCQTHKSNNSAIEENQDHY